ncbi:hypothetical protein JYU10_00865 [bacterium AH-315-J04]|nr:hypothetical protein [bacterium AH-315-J04]
MTNISRSRRLTSIQLMVLCAFTVIVGFTTPSLALLAVQIFVGGIPFGSAYADIIFKQFAAGHNLFILALIGLIPFVALLMMMLSISKKYNARKCYALYCCGLIGILGFMIPSHVSVWYPLYGPGRMSSTAVIAFLFIPFWCIGTMFIGIFIGRQIIKIKWFQAFPAGHCQHCGYDLTGNVSGKCSECGQSIGG